MSGRRKADDLIYAGKVDHGCDKASATVLRKRLTPLIRKTQSYAKRIAHKAIWVESRMHWPRSSTAPNPQMEKYGIRFRGVLMEKYQSCRAGSATCSTTAIGAAESRTLISGKPLIEISRRRRAQVRSSDASLRSL